MSASSPASARNPVDTMDQAWDWVSLNWSEILIASAAGLVIYLLLGLLKGLLIRIFARGAKSAPFMSVLEEAAARTGHVFMLLVAARLVVGYADPPPTVFRTIGFLFTVVTAWQVAIWVRQIVLGLIRLRSNPEMGGSEALANASGLIKVLVSVAVFAVAIIVVLDNLGVNVTGLVAGLGIGGIAIGLAAQGIFSDLFASLSIIFDQPFKVGDAINFGSQTATVERIGLKSTRLRAVTGERIVVSNAQLLNKEITAYSGLDRRRLKFAVGVIYQTAPEVAEGIPVLMRELVEANGGVFVRAGFVGFGASSLDFEVEFDVFSTDWEEIYSIRHRIGLAILRRFNEGGVEFAYPTQTTFTAAPDGRMIMPYPADWGATVPPVQTSPQATS
ncbi:mechanosensitive ion channel family protein [Sphingobium sp. SYK-6]|uniref:mechanosensitive ion channel family protein n=1 Tax=Sphingobium sp. (strain NBRC 103272 / SYK-6) TaxID=627192 RepID=UPI0011D19D84|nr:mechanosensitive ion channel domain-containing protein [Sphingobium sp. SYK-6]